MVCGCTISRLVCGLSSGPTKQRERWPRVLIWNLKNPKDVNEYEEFQKKRLSIEKQMNFQYHMDSIRSV